MKRLKYIEGQKINIEIQKKYIEEEKAKLETQINIYKKQADKTEILKKNKKKRSIN